MRTESTVKRIVRKTLEELMPEIQEIEKSIELEFTNVCNAVCTMCPRTELHRGKGYMTLETLSVVLDRAKEYGVNQISIGGFGEPLLHKEFLPFIQLIRNELPKAKISITSNGLMLTPELVKKLMVIGMPEFSISFHNDNKEDYERTMKISHAKVVENLSSILTQIPESAKFLRLGIVKTKENKDQVNAIMEFWSNLGLKHFTVLIGHNRGGQLTDERLIDDAFYQEEGVQISAVDKLLCKKASIILKFVDWEGIIRLCCNDLKGKTLLTDLKHGSFEDAEANRIESWNNAQMDFCKTCNMPSTLLKAQLVMMY